MNTILKKSGNVVNGDDLINNDSIGLSIEKDSVVEDPFDRIVLPERDLSTEGSSDDNEQIQELQRKMTREEALR